MCPTRRSFLEMSSLSPALLWLGETRAHVLRTNELKPSSSRSKRDVGLGYIHAPPSNHRGDAALSSSRMLADETWAEQAVEWAVAQGASYADARLMASSHERIRVRDTHIDKVARDSSYGLGLRVIVDGAWGFAATSRLTKERIRSLVKVAVRSAKVHAKQKMVQVHWADAPVVKAMWASHFEVDPFSVPIAEKAELLLESCRVALSVPGIQFASAGVHSVREEKLLINHEGARIHQLYHRIFPTLTTTAVNRRLGRFSDCNHTIPPMLAGWEHVVNGKLVEQAPELADQTLRKLYADAVEPGRRQVILAPSNLWLTIHESIGHPTELDRAIGLEANYAGTSFMTPDQTGRLQVGANIVHLYADRTLPGGLATTGWDDDGVASQRWDIIKNGKLQGWQTTRDQASWIGEQQSRGCSYADNFDSVAFQRMPNISLAPGSEGYTTEDLIKATDDGILISGRGSWSIDQQRYNFQFSGQTFWEIKKGRLTRPLRDVAYQANSLEFWRSCDMIGGKESFRLGGSFTDGKGQPGQRNAVSHGCPPARFTVNILNTGEKT